MFLNVAPRKENSKEKSFRVHLDIGNLPRKSAKLASDMNIVVVEYRLHSRGNALTVHKGIYAKSLRYGRRKRWMNVKPLRSRGREPL